MNNWKVWRLYDKDGNLIAEGRKRDVVRVAYARYVYGYIFTDELYRTNQSLASARD